MTIASFANYVNKFFLTYIGNELLYFPLKSLLMRDNHLVMILGEGVSLLFNCYVFNDSFQ